MSGASGRSAAGSVGALRSLCVYCGSSTGRHPGFTAAARDLGRLLATRDITLVYGGGQVGLMGELASAALAAGGRVIGVIPGALVERELALRGVTELHVTTTMHERKARMLELADAFIALPGGIGTLDELFEIWTWANLGFHVKPFGMLNVDGFFDPLLAFLDRTVDAGYLGPGARAMLRVEATATALLPRLEAAIR